MSWRPNADISMARARAKLLGRLREYFQQQVVLEVSTPALTSGTATDPNIDSFNLRLGDQNVYLHTSPEHFMKRLLAAGYPDIYQVSRVFRKGEAGCRHMPEFTMAEWYRLGFRLREIMDDTINLVTALFAKREFATAEYLSYENAFSSAIGLCPLDTTSEDLANALDADTALRKSLGNDHDAWLDLAMATRVARSFANDRLTVVYHYPASQASLARVCPDNDEAADRFELYCGPVELANGFVELTDPDEQLRRFEDDRRKRQEAGKSVPDVDEALINALRAGLPECAGVALGLDRLLMIDEGRDDIREVTSFAPGS